jgi:hypothetical protein
MNETTEPITAAVGDLIAHDLMPEFVMAVEETRDCETDWNRSQPHLAYRITDPVGQADWVCSYDVHKVGGGSD